MWKPIHLEPQQLISQSFCNEFFPPSPANLRTYIGLSQSPAKQPKKLPPNFVVRQYPNVEGHRLGSYRSPAKRRDVREKAFQTELIQTNETLLNLSGSFHYQGQNLLDNDESDVQRMPRIRRKSDTSSWSGGLSSLEKKIGFFVYGTETVKRKELPFTEAGSKSPTKKKNALRKAVLMRESFRMDNAKELRRLATTKDLSGKRNSAMTNRSDSLLDTSDRRLSRNSIRKERGDISTDSINVPDMTTTNTVKASNFSEACKKEAQDQSSVPIYQTPQNREDRNKVVPRERKPAKRITFNRYTSLIEKSPEPRILAKTTKETPKDSRIRSNSKKSLKRPINAVEEPKSQTSMTPTLSYNALPSENSTKADSLGDAEILNIKEENITPGICSMERVDLVEKKHLPIIEEENKGNKLRKRILKKSEKVKDSQVSSVKSLNNLPSISAIQQKTEAFQKRQKSSILEERRTVQLKKMKTLQDLCFKVHGRSKPQKLFKPRVSDLKEMITTYMLSH